MTGRRVAMVWMAVMLAGPVTAQELELGGEIRPRAELRSPVYGPGRGEDRTLDLTSMRTRLSAAVALAKGVRGFVQLQDVRVWGEEASTTDGAGNALDLHQGWVELGSSSESPWSVRVGRQEVAYGDERLLGALDWAQQGRAMDGIRLRLRSSSVVVDGLAMTLGEWEAGAGESALYGLYGTVGESGSLQAYALYNTADEVMTEPLRHEGVTDQYTLGGRWAAGEGALEWRLEGAYQLGRRDAQDVSAYLVAAEAAADLGSGWRVGVLYDRLSGDDEPTDATTRVFDTLFATNHKFYGSMDLFLNIPVQTSGRGLQDVGLESRYALTPDVSVALNGHLFSLSATSGAESARLGEELDFTARWAYAPGVAVTAGASYFSAQDAWTVVLGREGDHQGWAYVMLDVRF